jgi:signal transduction histidine kinase
MRLMAEDRGIQLQFPPSAPMIVRGDPSRLKQVIVNLLDNAIRFTPRGGAVTLRTGDSGGDIVLEVLRHRYRHSGCGPRARVRPVLSGRRGAFAR